MNKSWLYDFNIQETANYEKVRKFLYAIRCFVVTGLNPICLHSQDATMVGEKRKGKSWVQYERGGKLYMYVCERLSPLCFYLI